MLCTTRHDTTRHDTDDVIDIDNGAENNICYLINLIFSKPSKNKIAVFKFGLDRELGVVVVCCLVNYLM